MSHVSDDLFQLPSKKRTAFLQKLSDAGLTGGMMLNALAADKTALEHWVRQCPQGGSSPTFKPTSGIVCDAKTVCGVLGLPCDCSEEAPEPADHEVVVWYGGWTLGELVATGKVVNYLSKEWETWKAPAGYYHARIPVPKSDGMKQDEYADLRARSYAAFKWLPTPVGATALAAHVGVTGKDLLNGKFCQCAEKVPSGHFACLGVLRGLVEVGSGCWIDGRYRDTFLGLARKS